MSDVLKNPFTPVETWEDTKVTIEEGDEKKKVDAKYYKIRYLVGESENRQFIDSGTDEVAKMSEKTIFLSPAVHRLTGDPFHYDRSRVEFLSGEEEIRARTKNLDRKPACEDHKTIEVIFESPGVECCSMSMEEADKKEVPLQYIAGYMLGKTKGLLKVALSRTVLDNGKEYYDNIHIIPESAVKQWACLE
jgi:hypothetical protein